MSSCGEIHEINATEQQNDWKRLIVTVLLVCPDRPPDVSMCWAHVLLFVVGAMCSPAYCLSPPALLSNHCFSCSTCVSLVTLVCLLVGLCVCVCVCVCVLTVQQFSACFSPSGVFCCSLFYFIIIKANILLHLSPRLHLSSQSLTPITTLNGNMWCFF